MTRAEWYADLQLLAGVEHFANLPVVLAAKQGRLEHEAMRRFLLQVGVGIIFPFYQWVVNVRKRTVEGTDVHAFMLQNEREEVMHGKLWRMFARQYGLTEADFGEVKLAPKMAALFAYVTRQSHQALPIGLAVVNYGMEVPTARMAQEIPDDYVDSLGTTGGMWLRIHKLVETEHAAGAKRFLMESVDQHDQWANYRADVMGAVQHTLTLYYAAFEEAYPDGSEARR